jgi:hypothetical protein
LKPCGGLKAGALLAAMQSNAAFGTISPIIRTRAECRGTVVTARGCHRLYQARQSGASDVKRGAGTLRPGAFVTPRARLRGITAGVLIAVLPILAIAFHKMQVGSLLVVSYIARLGLRARLRVFSSSTDCDNWKPRAIQLGNGRILNARENV